MRQNCQEGETTIEAYAMGDQEPADEDGLPGPLPTPPGLSTERVGPLGVPLPVPAVDAVDVDFTAPAADTPEDPGETDQSPIGTGGTEELQEAVEYGESYLDRVETALDNETCSFCADLLRNLRGLPIEEQVQGVRELAELKEMMKDDASQEAVEDAMDEFEVLSDPTQFM